MEDKDQQNTPTATAQEDEKPDRGDGRQDGQKRSQEELRAIAASCRRPSRSGVGVL